MQRYRPQLSFLFLLVLWYGALDWAYRQLPDQLLADRIYRWGINEVAADILYFVLVSHPAWFVPLHVSVIPMTVIAFSAMFYLWWTHWAMTRNTDVAG